MHTTTFDTLEFTEQLKAAGVPDDQTKGHAKALMSVIKQTETCFEDLVTKTDLQRSIAILEYRMTIRMGLMLVTVAGMLFTALRYFPPLAQINDQPPAQEMHQPTPVPTLPAPPPTPAH
ncbi:MAG: hypothetical protein HQL87_16625 [Magnetococcales bacterium]|nr:hypothetical protein [Magnetococcales bacterium]